MVKFFVCHGCLTDVYFHSRSTIVKCPNCRHLEKVQETKPGKPEHYEEGWTYEVIDNEEQ